MDAKHLLKAWPFVFFLVIIGLVLWRLGPEVIEAVRVLETTPMQDYGGTPPFLLIAPLAGLFLLVGVLLKLVKPRPKEEPEDGES